MGTRFAQSFITLVQFDKVQHTEAAMGKIVVEVQQAHCRLSVWLQGMKKELFYKIVFVYEKEHQYYGFPLTDIYTNERGKGELKYQFDIDDVSLGGFSMEDFQFVVVQEQREIQQKPVLIGYRDTPTSWDGKWLDMPNKKEPRTIQQKLEQLSKEDLKKRTPIDISAYASAHRAKQPKEAYIEDLSQVFKEYVDFYQEQGVVQEHTPYSKQEELEILTALAEEEIEQQSLESENELNVLILNNPKMMPFEKQNREVYWVRIALEDLARLPFYEIIQNEPFFYQAYEENRHFILGYVSDTYGDNYYLGIPTQFHKEQKTLASQIGFTQFKCCDDIKPIEDAYGYWILKM